jgi:hypothetical protein
MSKKRKPKRIDKQAIANNLVALKLERTRIIGDMFSLADTSEEFQALHKQLEDLNADRTRKAKGKGIGLGISEIANKETE